MSSSKSKELMRMVMQHFKTSNSFSRVLSNCELVEGSVGRTVVKMKVLEEHCNAIGTLHGGMSATLVDNITSLALITDDEDSVMNLGVSIDLNLSYLKGAKLGEEILIEAEILKRGKKLCFTECEIKNKETGELLVKGRHTKYLLK